MWIPWSRLGIRISKIGGVEFSQVVQVQAKEHAEDLRYLEDRIEALEVENRAQSGADVFETLREKDLREILLSFLTKYKDWAFSPARIRAWGSKQQGFSSLASYEHIFVRRTLEKMVSENILETRISKRGNTLYRIPLT